jgi:hypothetical protein
MVNLVAVHRYRARSSWLMRLACGHYQHTGSYLVAGLGYLKCPPCDGRIMVTGIWELDSTWAPDCQ